MPPPETTGSVVERPAGLAGSRFDARFPGNGRFAMNIEYLHASKFGNGAAVAAEFKNQMAAKGVVVGSITSGG
jgi:hypothetical protein